MADLNMSNTTTTSLDGSYSDYSAPSASLDAPQTQDVVQEYPDAAEYFGYYKNIPELKKAIDMLALWTTAQGFETDAQTKVLLEHVEGWGEDTILSIFQNLIVVKKVVGDAFAEIVEKDGTLLNIKPISPERIRTIISPKGIIKHYEHLTGGKWRKIEKEKILHLCNDRIADETHGTSVIESCKWVIDALQEAMRDHRIVLHRNRCPVRILEFDSDNTTKRDKLIQEYQDAIKNGEVLVLPKGVAQVVDNQIVITDPTSWIATLQNYFYIAVGIPRVIATSEGFTEAGGKVGFLTFEPIYTNEQTQLEADLWNQLAIKIKFNRPPSLKGVMSEDEQKNTGQVGIQPQDTQATITQE